MEQLDAYMTLRVTKTTHQEFMQKAQRYGKPSDVLREIIEAFLSDRLVIQPDPKKESLYVTRN